MPHFFIRRLVQPMQTLKTPLSAKEEKIWGKHLVWTSDLCTHVHICAYTCNTNIYTNENEIF